MTAGTYTESLKVLAAKGLSYGTVMDIGSADGHFFLQHLSLGFFAGAVPVNVDANPIYEDSLKAIRDTVGGHYAIAAVTDHLGEAELTLGSHPYWSSLKGENDAYWRRMNQLRSGTLKVPAVTVDSLVRQFGLRPPFLLKLDIQGAELSVLTGARETLTVTDVVICEIDLGDFPGLDRAMDETGFSLFDLTDLRRLTDGALSWFYAVYLNRRRDGLRMRTLWDPALDQQIAKAQRDRRESVLEYNAQVLAKIRAARGKA